MTRPARIALLGTHLMGSGHFARMLHLARALRRAGAEAVTISGGRALPHLADPLIPVVHLPAVTIRGLDYGTLLRPDGAPADAAWMAARREAIAKALADFAPDVLVTELFPFGRRILAAEFEAAAALRPSGCRLVCSVRDAPEPPKPEKRAKRAAEAAARLDAYDLVLAHGDEGLLPLGAVWPGGGVAPPDAVAGKLLHTGYVAEPLPAGAPDGPGAGEVLVSVGSGGIGRALLASAAEAARGHPLLWRLLVGGAEAAAEAARLGALGPAIAEPARADFRAMLPRATLSISLAGYNTAVEAAMRGGPSLLIPMNEGGEQEQILRARAFAALPGLRAADPEVAASPAALRAAADRALAEAAEAPGAEAPRLRTDGAAVSAAALIALAQGEDPRAAR